ncbi:hypothetical protein CONPUDRAFT_77723 [Coniophora puteana RWD-64-598 SS2]|uniref:Uncharacterized protein n=1 Tax=Coniophora puteana (strain RWD-64-598) TaxID=741705 RepID=A0A5M3M810_CONPW|nr:uncharacterized protein CONPUDRAFT_77723 [Coniophora puteana RWD-64-598 SS2]EIW74930.1 hypothetical protein CONPUDRAFT_77723 [Coniophora puteana RWD-64-598 SS2]
MVCRMLEGSSRLMSGNINELYSSIIDGFDDSVRSIGLHYLFHIIHLAEPLSPSELRRLFGKDVHLYLLPFSALMSVPSSDSSDLVQPFHTSFRDFLQIQMECIRLAGPEVHRLLTYRCFSVMAGLLKRDICGLANPSLFRTEISDFAQRRDKNIPLALRYACRHWLYHLRQTTPDDGISGHLLAFLETKVLFAIEVYALLGELAVGAEILRAARKHVTGWTKSLVPRNGDILILLYDSWRLTLDFFDPISASALHVYESALVCSPAESQIRRVYGHVLAEATVFIFEDGLDPQWNKVIRVVQLDDKFGEHDSGPYRVRSVSVSPDGSQAVIECGKVISLLDTATGTIVTSLHKQDLDMAVTKFCDICICHTGLQIIISTQSNSFRCLLWKLSDRSITSFDLPLDACPLSLACSYYDGRKIAILGSSEQYPEHRWPRGGYYKVTINIYDADSETHQQLSHWEYQTQNVIHPMLEFSLKGDWLMADTQCEDGIFIFDSTSGQLLWHLLCKSGLADHFFSPDGDYILHALKRETSSPYSFHSIPERSASASRSPCGTVGGCRPTASEERTFTDHTPERVVDDDNKIIGTRVGDSVSTRAWTNYIYSTAPDRGPWRRLVEGCFHVIAHGRDSLAIVDMVQASAQGHPRPVHVAENEDTSRSWWPHDWSAVGRSDQCDMIAFKPRKDPIDDAELSTRYHIYDTNSTTCQCEILLMDLLEANGMGHGRIPGFPRFSPKSTYFALAVPNHARFAFGLWNSRTGMHLGSTAIDIVLDDRDHTGLVSSIHFSEDETVVAMVYGYPEYSTEDPDLTIAFISLEQGDVRLVALFPNPDEEISFLNGRTLKVISVTRDSVDWWGLCRGDTVCHLHWRRATSEIVKISSVESLRHGFTSVEHTPSLQTIHCRNWQDQWFRMRLSPESDSEDALDEDSEQGKYILEEDNDETAVPDTLSWSDLCLDPYGWFRKRNHRLFWLPARYRPVDYDEDGLKLAIVGDRVTIQGLKNDRTITIRLLNTEIDYFV